MTEEKSKLNFSKEAQAYTPGLKVKRAMTIYKTRRLPILGDVQLKVGDEISYEIVVARAQLSGYPEIVKVSMLLGMEPGEIPRYLTKKVGDKVVKDEVIADYSALFGLIKKQVVSPIDGIVESISESTGQMIVRGPSIPLEVNAYVPGKVVDILPREGVVIETNAAFIQGILGIGGETHGKIKMGVDSPDEKLMADHITLEDKGKVLIGGSLVALEAINKAVKVGVSCIVTGGIRHDDLTTLIGEEIGVAITGHEEVGLTLIITEGFGQMKMSQRIFDLLKSFVGYTASVNGTTQIRAGVMRPEIIIPHEESFEQASDDKLAAGMIPGTPVRIIRKPYFGAIGKVLSLPVELQYVDSGSYVRILEVELDDGMIVTIPRANVEIIEE